ncbi:MAG: hypothetical protein UZ16_OP3001002548 [Candidatus Hinthialibacteria bacterium OLB16]|nr:MAG: hypothetical protein UZ16_OP3001002548 [Candidatus Hinthialibacteria bacterium OLB16]
MSSDWRYLPVNRSIQSTALGEIATEATGEIDRANMGACSQRHPDDLAIVDQLTPLPAFGSQFPMLSHKDGLGASESRLLPEQAGMAGQPETPWVGISLAIDHHQIRLASKQLPGGMQQRELTKREQPGNIGK